MAAKKHTDDVEQGITNCDTPLAITAIQSKIFTLRGVQVMLDRDLALCYGVDTRRVNEQMKRNIDRFPEDFVFQLTHDELKILMSQNATSNWGGDRKLPFPLPLEYTLQMPLGIR